MRCEISVELLRELLKYEPETGKLYWRKRPVEMFCAGVNQVRFCNSFNSKYAGKEAFINFHSAGYLQGFINNRKYFAHRVAFAIEMGWWPEQVDHINGVRADNRIVNIRPANRSVNGRNTKLFVTNTSGVAGVCWDAGKSLWVATIYNNGLRVDLGASRSFDDAVSARKTAEARYQYDTMHGLKQTERAGRPL